MSTLIELKKELKPYKNTLVLDFFNVVRLVDVVDGEEDYYWVYDTPNGLKQSSCVMGWIPLKGKLNDDEYNHLVKIWNYNNTVKAI